MDLQTNCLHDHKKVTGAAPVVIRWEHIKLTSDSVMSVYSDDKSSCYVYIHENSTISLTSLGLGPMKDAWRS
jgi:hypothetical protein